MATATAIVHIGGTKMLPYHIHVEQRSDWHHRFEVMVSTEKANVMDGLKTAAESLMIENALTYAGETVEINIDRPSGSFVFKGYVTDVHLDQTFAGDTFIVFRGFSPTYLLDGQISVDSFEEKTLKDIFNKVSSDLPGNIEKKVKPKFSKSIPYVVRYKESQYQFLSRMAATYGEWFYYDGQKIVFGELAKGAKVELTFGADSMLSFNYGISVRSNSFKQQFYKATDNAVVEESVASYKPGWLDSHGKIAHDAATNIFSEEGIDPVNHRVKDQAHIKHLAEAKKSGILSNAMLFNGQSADPRVAIGAEVEVSSKKGFIGKYRVISVSHHFSSNRDYYNQFKAIPLTNTAPPTDKGIVMPKAEPQAAIVTDNNDPDKQGRVRVQHKWQEGQTPWIRVLTNHAGEDRGEGVYGLYFIPEIGDEVFVEYEQGNPARPYVVGSHYHGSIPPEFADADNNLKAIKTRSGHILQFDDTDGDESILITDRKGNCLTIKTAGDEIIVKAGDAIKIEAGNTINLEAGRSISLGAPNINLVASATVNISAAASYSLVTANKMDIVSANTMLRTKNLNTMVGDKMNLSAKNIFQSAKESIETKAKKEINISATKELNQRAGEVKLASQKGKILVNAKTSAEIKGKQVKNN